MMRRLIDLLFLRACQCRHLRHRHSVAGLLALGHSAIQEQADQNDASTRTFFRVNESFARRHRSTEHKYRNDFLPNEWWQTLASGRKTDWDGMRDLIGLFIDRSYGVSLPERQTHCQLLPQVRDGRSVHLLFSLLDFMPGS